MFLSDEGPYVRNFRLRQYTNFLYFDLYYFDYVSLIISHVEYDHIITCA